MISMMDGGGLRPPLFGTRLAFFPSGPCRFCLAAYHIGRECLNSLVASIYPSAGIITAISNRTCHLESVTFLSDLVLATHASGCPIV